MRLVALLVVVVVSAVACGRTPGGPERVSVEPAQAGSTANQTSEILPLHIGAAAGGAPVVHQLNPDGTALELTCTSGAPTLTLETTSDNSTYVSQGLTTVTGASIPIAYSGTDPSELGELGGSLLTFVDEAPGGWVRYQLSGSVSADNFRCDALLQVEVQSVPTQTAATVTQIAPDVIGQPTTNLPVTVTGSNFVAGTTLSTSGTGVTFTSVQVTSPTLITATVSVAAGTATGSRDVTVTAPGGASATCSGCLVLDTVPTSTAVTHPVQTGAEDLSISLDGTGFTTTQGGTAVRISGSGVQVDKTTVVSANRITLEISAPTSSPGSYDVTVTNPDGFTSTCTGCLTVTQGPTITTFSPGTLTRQTSTPFTVTGSHFSPDVKVAAQGLVRFTEVTVNSDGTVATASAFVGQRIYPSSVAVTVVNPSSVGGGRATSCCIALQK